MIKKLLAVLLTFCMFFTFSAAVSAEATVFKMQEDFEQYKETTDFLLFWSAQRKNKAVNLVLDTNNIIKGKNSLRTDYDLNQKPGWATIIHYPNQETYSDALPNNCDGIKFTIKSTCPIRIRVGVGFNYISSQKFIYASPQAREYTIRFNDFVGVEDESFDFKTAAYFSGFDTVIFGEDQISGFQNSGSVWYDNIYFFKGSDATDLSTADEAISHADPTTSPSISTTLSSQTENTTAPSKANESTVLSEMAKPTAESAVESTVESAVETNVESSAVQSLADPAVEPYKTNGRGWVIWLVIGVVVIAAACVVGWFFYRNKRSTDQ